MTGRVLTEFTCDVCGRVETLEGYRDPPNGWTARRPGPGVSDTHICPTCTPAVPSTVVIKSAGVKA